MKVLQINSVCGFGSTGRIATDLHAKYEEIGYESYIAYGRNQPLNCDENQTIKIGTRLDNYKHVLKTRVLDQHGFGSKKATNKFIEKLKKLDPEIIHLHNLHGYYINIEMLFDYLKETNKPVIWTLHDCWAFTGHCVHFEYEGCECWKPDGDHHCIQKKKYPRSWITNNSRNNYARKKRAFTGLNNLIIVTPSKWLAKLVEKSFLNEYPVRVINNGINLDSFGQFESNFRERNNLENKFVILGVANGWNKTKGLKYFKELISLISSEEVIVLVGLSDKQIKTLPPEILGISKTNNIQELAEIYSAADIFINPTLEDNFPTTNIESLVCGTPVITFDTGGSPEIISQASGIVTKEKTSESILEAIAEVRKNRLSEREAKLRGKQFSIKKMFNQYNQLYLNMIIDEKKGI